MNRIRNKLQSRRGASITFALLLFLVCAVISSVVIVAASTAGGRLSTVREMDQRYYAATAAADVLRQTLDGKTAIVSYQTSDTGATTATTTARGILGDASGLAVTGGSQALTAIPPIENTVDNVEYTCTITGTVNNGLLTFDIAAGGGKFNKNGIYTLQLVFTSTVMKTEEASTTEGSLPTGSSGKAKVTWKTGSIRKIRGGA